MSKHMLTRDDLYECRGKYEFLVELILAYNNLHFYTTTSQPGTMINTSANYCRKQRAYIRGYMHSDMAEFIYQNINHDDIVVRTELHNRGIPSYACECGSVMFIDDKPGTMTFDSKIDYEQSFNLGLQLRRPYNTNKEYFKIPQNLENMMEFDIVDLRWDNNDDLWNLLFDKIMEYNSMLVCT